MLKMHPRYERDNQCSLQKVRWSPANNQIRWTGRQDYSYTGLLVYRATRICFGDIRFAPPFLFFCSCLQHCIAMAPESGSMEANQDELHRAWLATKIRHGQPRIWCDVGMCSSHYNCQKYNCWSIRRKNRSASFLRHNNGSDDFLLDMYV